MKTYLPLSLRAALVAAVLPMVSYTLSTAHAAGVAESRAELSTPTLTGLHQLEPELYPSESGYQLEEVTGDILAEDISIFKYLYNAELGTYTPVQYNVVFDVPLGDEKPANKDYTYFQWQQDTDTEIWSLIETQDESLADVKAYSSNSNRLVNNSRINVHYSFLGLSEKQDFASTGGALYNDSTIHLLLGDFIANSASSDNLSYYRLQGGAIYNNDAITTIQGNFISNTASANSSVGSITDGGAIYNNNSIGTIRGDFISNSVYTTSAAQENFAYASGGAIFNNGTITTIVGDFISSSAAVHSVKELKITLEAAGGAIHNKATITTIRGDFISNSTSASEEKRSDSSINSFGGAIYNSSAITNVIGDFISNSASAAGAEGYNTDVEGQGKINAFGGAIYNSSTIGSVTGNFISNSTSVLPFDMNLETNNLYAHGGAIYNRGTLSAVTGDFISNSASSSGIARGGAIYNYSTITNIIGNFIANSTYSLDATPDPDPDEPNWAADAYGGAIYNYGTLSTITGDFISNSVSSAVTAQGGAIYNDSASIGFLALDRSMQFSGNYTRADGSTTRNYEAIFNDGKEASSYLNFNAYASQSIVVNDGITGDTNSKDNQIIHINNGFDGAGEAIKADGKAFSTVAFNSFVDNQSITVHAGELRLGKFAGLGSEGEGGYVPATQAALNNTDITINAGARLSVQGQLELDSSSSITTSTEGAAGAASTIKGLASDSSISGGSITLEEGSRLHIENITLKDITLNTGSGALTLQNIRLGYDNVTASGSATRSGEAAPISYTLQGVDVVGVAEIAGSFTLDVSMIAAEFDAFRAALESGVSIIFNLEGLDEAQLPAGISYATVNGQSYYATFQGSSSGTAQFSIIPEPSTATLSLLALTGLLARRRRKAA